MVKAIRRIVIAIENGLIQVNIVVDKDIAILIINIVVTYKCEN